MPDGDVDGVSVGLALGLEVLGTMDGVMLGDALLGIAEGDAVGVADGSALGEAEAVEERV